MLAGPKESVEAALAARTLKGPLAEFAARPFGGHFRVFAVPGALPAVFENAAAVCGGNVPPPFDGLAVNTAAMRSILLEVDLEGPNLLAVEAGFPDADAAAQGVAMLALDEADWEFRTETAAREVERRFGVEAAALYREMQGGVGATLQGNSLRIVLPRLQKLSPSLEAFFARTLPALQAKQRQVQTINRVRNLLLAIMTYDYNQGGPPPETLGADGASLLSWRAKVLPYIERGDLYRRMKWDEGCDGPTNRPLGATRLQQLESEGVPPGRTAVFVVTGPGTLYPKPGQPAGEIKDRPADTIRLIVAKPERAVPWLKPGGELVFDPDHPEKLLEALPEENVVVGFFDGHVEVWTKRPSAEVLKALVTIAGGEKVEHPQ